MDHRIFLEKMASKAEQKVIKRRDLVFDNVTRILNKSSDRTSEIPDAKIQIYLEKLDELWNEFYSIESGLSDETESIADDFSEKFYDAKSNLLTVFNARNESNNKNTNDMSNSPNAILNAYFDQQRAFLENLTEKVGGNVTAMNNSMAGDTVRLPKINIEPFNGDYMSWPNFIDLFNSSVHNSALPNVHKFQILKGLLKGAASELLEGLAITDENYASAYEKLCKRYDKKKAILNSLINSFLKQPGASDGNIHSLRQLTEFSDKTIRGIKSLGASAESRDPWLISLVLSKIDANTQEAWSLKTVDQDFPSFESFLEFLSVRCDAKENSMQMQPSKGKTFKPASNIKSFQTDASKTNSTICPHCNYQHNLSRCFKFRKLSVENRRTLVNKYQLCYNCLRQNHTLSNCPIDFTCKQCNQKHHTLLHIDKQSTINSTSSSKAPVADSSCSTSLNSGASNSKPVSFHSSTNNITHTHVNSQETNNFFEDAQCFNALSALQTVLPTALVYVRDANGQNHVARVLFDTASTATFINDSFVQRLGLHRTQCTKSISGIGDTPAGVCKGLVSMKLQSRFNSQNEMQINALVLRKISNLIPSSPIDIRDVNINGFNLADPNFHNPSKIDILLGAERVFHCLTGETKFVDNIAALSTIFGWVIGGEVNPSHGCVASIQSMSTTDEEFNVSLHKFWSVEEVPENFVPKASEIENHFLSHISRDNSRYIVRLPFIQGEAKLGNSKKAAIMRLFAMERRFIQNPVLKEEYVKFMDEFLHLKHMERVPKHEIDLPDENLFYLPHHAVLKPDSTTTKLRVVFDGSCRTSTGVSLNEKLLIGSNIQDDLVSVIVRFRKHPIVFTADIEKMYRQVLVHQDDRDFQRIVWRKEPTDPIEHFRLCTVTYGTASASFLAIRTLHHIVDDHPAVSKNIVFEIKRNFYVDDYLSGCEDVAEAKTIIHEISSVLSNGSFTLRKWKSNSVELLKSIPDHLKEQQVLKFTDESPICTKVLGLQWNASNDCFSFRITLKDELTVTKRSLLSQIAKIFDPLGWLSPITISLKIIFQKTWLTAVGWDDEIPEDANKMWNKIKSQLHLLEEIQIPRHLSLTRKCKMIHLLAFCDASESAYGAVAYLRAVDDCDNVFVRLIAAKTKVKPIKKITLPRLELSGALLLSNLVNYLRDTLNINGIICKAWCDSQVVLAWLSSNPAKWKPFVGNRTQQILEILPRSNWLYIRSKENPADIASRGSFPALLRSNDLWWNGPSWLVLNETEWPNYETNSILPDAQLESRKINPITALLSVAQNHVVDVLFERFNSFRKIKRIIAYILKMRKTHRESSLVDRLRVAELVCVKYVQERSFKLEMLKLQSNQPIDSNSKILQLAPFLDDDGILRVGGRLKNANLNVDQKHPIILPKIHKLSKIVTHDAHIEHLHAGPSLLSSIIKQKFWIIGCRDLARSICKSCIICFRWLQQTQSQLMGSLPINRVSPSRAFQVTGVDLAGPITLRVRKGPGRVATTKGYIVIFICLSVKAVHIEVVSDMTTESYLAALKRFIGRRSKPDEIISDNGSNFVGASRELKELYNLFKSQAHMTLIQNFLSHQEIKCSFIPARAPHFGGLWESNIKSIKYHLKRVVNAPNTYEEFSTLLVQIEGLLNSRPLWPMSEDVHDLNVLTPGHFLVGGPLTSLPEPCLAQVPTSRLSRWQNIQSRVQQFWKKWSLEYLHTLQQRQKWKQENANFNVGELVIVKEDNIPPNQWVIGRITAVHRGDDNLVRVVTVKMKNGEFKRPIVKLARLPMESSESSESTIINHNQQHEI